MRELNKPSETNPVMFNCSECKRDVTRKDVNYSEPMRMRLMLNQLCFTCHHWTEKLHYQGPMAVVRVNGHHYMYDTRMPYVENDGRQFLGHGGAKWWIDFLLGEALILTNNLWYQGEIPDHFRKRLPDNAVFRTDPAKAVALSSSPAS
jgi:hypothetical protein